jgi:hypothetical protein
MKHPVSKTVFFYEWVPILSTVLILTTAYIWIFWNMVSFWLISIRNSYLNKCIYRTCQLFILDDHITHRTNLNLLRTEHEAMWITTALPNLAWCTHLPNLSILWARMGGLLLLLSAEYSFVLHNGTHSHNSNASVSQDNKIDQYHCFTGIHVSFVHSLESLVDWGYKRHPM